MSKKKKVIDWDDHSNTDPVPWDDLVAYICKNYPNPLNDKFAEGYNQRLGGKQEELRRKLNGEARKAVKGKHNKKKPTIK